MTEDDFFLSVSLKESTFRYQFSHWCPRKQTNCVTAKSLLQWDQFGNQFGVSLRYTYLDNNNWLTVYLFSSNTSETIGSRQRFKGRRRDKCVLSPLHQYCCQILFLTYVGIPWSCSFCLFSISLLLWAPLNGTVLCWMNKVLWHWTELATNLLYQISSLFCYCLPFWYTDSRHAI